MDRRKGIKLTHSQGDKLRLAVIDRGKSAVASGIGITRMTLESLLYRGSAHQTTIEKVKSYLKQ